MVAARLGDLRLVKRPEEVTAIRETIMGQNLATFPKLLELD